MSDVFITIRRMLEDSRTYESRDQVRDGRWCSVEKQFKEEELLAIEKEWSIKIPGSYREFLGKLGAGVYFSTYRDYQVGVELRRLDDFLQLVASSSRGEKPLIFSEHLPIGWDREQRHLLLLRMDKGHEGEVVLTACVPKSWDQLKIVIQAGVPFEAWLERQIEAAS